MASFQPRTVGKVRMRRRFFRWDDRAVRISHRLRHGQSHQDQRPEHQHYYDNTRFPLLLSHLARFLPGRVTLSTKQPPHASRSGGYFISEKRKIILNLLFHQRLQSFS